MKKTAFAIAAAASAALFSGSPSAHHSTAMFDWGNAVELKDVKVLRWAWTNPHTFLYVVSTDEAGNETRWAFEGMSPNHLSRAGWDKRTLRPGDQIDLTYYPLRDGRNGGFNVTATLSNGKVLKQLPQEQ